MRFSTYQTKALKTDQEKNFEVSIYGLVCEAGSLLNAFQIYQSIDDSYRNYRNQVKEDLGDILWYLSSVASAFKLKLSEIAKANIKKSIDVYESSTGRRLKQSTRLDHDELAQYQRWVKKTDIKSDRHISILGAVGEVGSVTTIAKKIRRIGHKSKFIRNQLEEELGDLLWYVTSVALTHKLTLEDVATNNLKLIHSRWDELGEKVSDEKCEPDERLPRKFSIRFIEKKLKNKKVQTLLQTKGINIGDRLTDNSYADDGYRYHDVFHLAYAAVLGWSPVIRKLLKRKRKYHSEIDEVEDGQRAAIIEEAIAISVYNQAPDFSFFQNQTRIDSYILASIRRMCQGLEVQKCTPRRWELAILQGYKIFDQMKKHHGGIVVVDLDKSRLTFKPPTGKKYNRRKLG